MASTGTSDALIMGRDAVVAERQPGPERLASGPAGRLNHGIQGPHVKVRSGEELAKSPQARSAGRMGDFSYRV